MMVCTFSFITPQTLCYFGEIIETLLNTFLGNTVRRVFKEPEFLADQIGASVELVTGLINIWIAMKENLVLDPQKFYDYCQEIKEKYIAEFPEYTLNPATLKVMDHGHLILMKLPKTLTLTMLSEVCILKECLN